MTSELDRLVHALLVPGFTGVVAPAWVLRRVEAGLGGVALFARNVADPEQLRRLTGSLHEVSPHLLVAVDEEGGDVSRVESAAGSRHLGALALGTVDDVALTRRVSGSIGTLLRETGIDWNWAPVADVNSNAANPVIGVRAYGSDAALVSRHVAAAVLGMQEDAGILACAKHFPGHGDTSIDSHHDLPVVTATADELSDVALAPFRACIDAGVRTVMTAHLRVLALDPDEPATLSRAVVTSLLRGELGFTGAVVSDALEMAGVAQHCGIEEGAVRALLAGVDALCLGGHLADEDVVERVHRAVVSAVRGGRLPEQRVEEAAERVAALAAWRDDRPDAVAPTMTDTESVAAGARALEVTGDVRLGSGPVVVVTCDPEPLVAAGPSPWGPSALLLDARPGSRAMRITPDAPPLDAEALGAGHVVLVVRDAHRHPWQLATITEVLARRPDAVVVEMGLLGSRVPGTRHIQTFGTSRGSVAAVVAALDGQEAT